MNEQEKHTIRRKEANRRLDMTKHALAYVYPELDTFAGHLPTGTAQPNRVEVFESTPCPACNDKGTITVLDSKHIVSCPDCEGGDHPHFSLHYTTTVGKFEKERN